MLEERILQLTSQMISAPSGNAGYPEMLLPIGHINANYDERLADLKRERECIEHEKTQVERYKQLLLKQRDIMIALTQRLNERDEQIMALQDELDAYDKNQAALESKLDEKTAQCIHLQRLSLEASGGNSQNKLLRRLRDTKDLAASECRWSKPLRVEGGQSPSALDHKRVEELTALLDLRDKERCAIQTIFEKKIVVLVDSIARYLAKPNIAPPNNLASAALKDLGVLSRLVRASVEALKQASQA